MSTGAVLAIAVIAVVVLAAVFLVVTARRSDRNAATGLMARETVRRDRESRRRSATGVLGDEPATGREVERAVVLARRGGGTEVVAAERQLPAVRPPLEPEALAVTRRQFFNRSITLMMTAGLGGFGASILAFLWPSLSGGFGSKIKVGKIDDILAEIKTLNGPKYLAEGRTYLQPYPAEALPKAKTVYSGAVLGGMEAGVVALYQKCVHLGCRVPWCATSQWFECPCHGSQYNRVGEKKGGPAPRGLDRFAVTVAGGVVTVDTAQRTEGPAIGTNTTGQEAEGPHCVSGS
jgi:cytochrome b6-f complex iron-sulfur subunit